MDNHVRSLEGLARQVRIAYESGDVASFAELLDPNVRWGPPGDPAPPCQNREQVLAWYERGSQAGMTARVSEVSVLGDRILVGLMVADSKASKQRGGAAARSATADGARRTGRRHSRIRAKERSTRLGRKPSTIGGQGSLGHDRVWVMVQAVVHR